MAFLKRGSREPDDEESALPDVDRSAGPPREEAISRDFFELEPEEVPSFRAAGPELAPRSRRGLRAALTVLVAVVLAGGLATAVILSLPQSEVKVPDLVGKMLGSALETAKRSGLTPRVEGWAYSDKHSDGVVLSQSPRSPGVVARGSEVSLTVSKGPRQESANPSPARGPAANPVAGKTVCLDPGHQATAGKDEWVDPGMTRRSPPDNGETGVVTGNPEYILTMDIATKLKNILEKDGINVILTRESGGIDLSNVMRAEIASNRGADLLVSIHLGYSEDASAVGTETLYPAETGWTSGFYEKSKTAALYIQADTVKSCGTADLGTKARDDLPMFNWSQVPVTEVLVAYLSNVEEDRLLATDGFRLKAAWGIRNGIIKYLSGL